MEIDLGEETDKKARDTGGHTAFLHIWKLSSALILHEDGHSLRNSKNCFSLLEKLSKNETALG